MIAAMPKRNRSVAALIAVAMLAACATAPQRPAAYAPGAGAALDVPAVTELGRALFFDASLSASGQVACASCHDPRFAWSPPNDRALQRAGRDGDRDGLRAAPSLRYLQTVPPFSEHHHDDDGDDSFDAGPTGGHTWDGRASSAHDQARLPLLSPDEMANASPAEVVERVRGGPHAARLRSLFGADVLDDADRGFAAVTMALEVFQQSPPDFYPYSSRYDEFLRGRATLSARERRGLALFDDPAKGNCASCHPSAVTAGGAFPLFTDFGLIALGAPRNGAGAGPPDLGLCGPLRTDFADRADYCGRFRTPTLRNVALKKRLFHNGVFASLDEVLRFYARRDVRPEEFYGRGRKFDDLPERFHANVNVEPPFGGMPGGKPSLDDDEIADLAAFLRTLTDADLVPPERPAR
jgi:cytochrome c peroxidase